MSKIERDNTMLDLAIKVILEFGDERYDIERVNLNISCQVVSNGENKGRIQVLLIMLSLAMALIC